MRTGVRRKRSPEKIKENKIQRAKKIMITGVEYYNACNYKLALIEFVKIESLE
jgi:hypothetical protein